jgi:L-malate glycosyltransferase
MTGGSLTSPIPDRAAGPRPAPQPGEAGSAGLKVLMVISSLGTAGAEWQVIHLAKGLAGRGLDVTLCALHRASPVHAQPLAEAGIQLLELGADKRQERALAVPRLARLARQADVVHCTNWDGSLWGRLAAMLAHRPVIVADHSTDRSIHVSRTGAARGRWVALHHRLLSRRTFATVACARSQLPLLRSEGVPPERLVYIPNGLPVDEVRAAALTGVDRADLGLPADAPVVMHVAKFRPEKNQAATLDIVAAVRERVPDARAVFVGHGPTLDGVQRRAEELGADWATFLGDRPDVPRLLGLADVVVLPSLSDTMPMLLLEAMAMGKPMVAATVGDVPLLLDETGAGVAVPVEDVPRFADAVANILTDAELRHEMSERGRRAASNYDAAAMVANYERIIRAAATGAVAAGGLAAAGKALLGDA